MTNDQNDLNCNFSCETAIFSSIYFRSEWCCDLFATDGQKTAATSLHRLYTPSPDITIKMLVGAPNKIKNDQMTNK